MKLHLQAPKQLSLLGLLLCLVASTAPAAQSIRATIWGIPSTATRLVGLLDGGGIVSPAPFAKNISTGTASAVIDIGTIAGGPYRLRILALGAGANLLSSGKVAGINVSSGSTVNVTPTLSPVTVSVNGSTPTSAVAGGVATMLFDIYDAGGVVWRGCKLDCVNGHRKQHTKESVQNRLLSVVTPCFNEEGNVQEVSDRVRRVMNGLSNYRYEHIFIDNASRDQTVQRLREIAGQDPNVKVICNARNFGHLRSPLYGIYQAGGDAVMLLFSDLQDPPEVLADMVKEWEKGYPVVLGIKKSSGESGLMFRVRTAYYRLVNRLTDIQTH
jgi:hypothetical protein